MSLTLGYKRIK